MKVLQLNKEIQVLRWRTKRIWEDAKVIHVTLEEIIISVKDEEKVEVLSCAVEFADGCTQAITDVFGIGSDDWRYKEKCCEQCKWHDVEGGDSVPYGMGTTCLPAFTICNCPDMSEEEIEDAYENTNGGAECNFFVRE